MLSQYNINKISKDLKKHLYEYGSNPKVRFNPDMYNKDTYSDGVPGKTLEELTKEIYQAKIRDGSLRINTMEFIKDAVISRLTLISPFVYDEDDEDEDEEDEEGVEGVEDEDTHPLPKGGKSKRKKRMQSRSRKSVKNNRYKKTKRLRY